MVSTVFQQNGVREKELILTRFIAYGVIDHRVSRSPARCSFFSENYAQAVRLLRKFIINDDCNESIIITVSDDFVHVAMTFSFNMKHIVS